MLRFLALRIFLALGLSAAPALAADFPPRPAGPGQTGAGQDVNYRIEIAAGPSTLPTVVGPVSRVKDIATIQTARDNQLIGYGLVIGLQGSGDGLRNSPFTEQSIRAMLQNLGIAMEGGQARARNVAAVIVTATLPPFVQSGARIDVSVSSLGDATSLQGGTLVMTPLRAPDGDIYAVAQGPVFISGFSAQGEAESLTRGVPTAGRIPNGAIVERQIEARFNDDGVLTLQLRNPDFSTAIRVTDVINEYTASRFGNRTASEQDSRTILVKRPANVTAARFVAEIENLLVATDTPAKVVVDERTGTIVIGQDVKISQVAVSYGQLTVRITEQPRVVQPAPFSRGETAEEPSTVIEADQGGGQVAMLDGPDLQTLVAGLNRIGVKPDGIIAILQGIKSAGALQADLVFQ
ncbi:flagellar basal body P-ring protein FlgI [Aquibium microcysteis]|uniref:flagellar basal body P-ring protein FlgI n=1 Tax=Aquibium microcysteis TaxID=675281 RepID=UPI00165D27F3|nr:flagellar basal body P-ring protein FlgI [Aquibium microcysteis]